MTKIPAISIITPVWNGLPFLEECIVSVLAQEFQNWELLISDNGSTDGTIAYLHSLTDPRIKIFKQEKNLGIMGNINFLFHKASAPLSQILCADDYFTTPASLSTIIKYWELAHPEIGFVRFNHLQPASGLTVLLQRKITPAVVHPEQSRLWYFIFGNIAGNLSNVSLRTHLVPETGWFNLDFPFAGDFEFWLRANLLVSMGVQNEVIVYVRRHDKVASNYLSLKGELYLQHITIYKKLIEELSYFFDRKDLIAYFNFEICSFHYRNGIKAALNGDFRYLKKFIRTKSSIDWPKWVQLSACLPLALFQTGRLKFTRNMAQNFINKYYKDQKSQLKSH